MLSEHAMCAICATKGRDSSQLCVVEVHGKNRCRRLQRSLAGMAGEEAAAASGEDLARLMEMYPDG